MEVTGPSIVALRLRPSGTPGEQHQMGGPPDRANPLGQHMGRYRVDVTPEEPGVVGSRLQGEGLHTRQGGQRRRRFVEADVAVAAHPKQLQIDPARGPDRLLVFPRRRPGCPPPSRWGLDRPRAKSTRSPSSCPAPLGRTPGSRPAGPHTRPRRNRGQQRNSPRLANGAPPDRRRPGRVLRWQDRDRRRLRRQ